AGPPAPPGPTGTGAAAGSWIAELAEIPHTADPAERDQELADLQQQVPGATLIDSDGWASLPPGHWIVRAPGEFANGYEALAACAGYGSDQCTGRYLSHDRADQGYACEAGPTPDPESCRRPTGGASGS
ncbi:serine/threonine protein kinase, partial [Kitasatospora sp. NPDC058965]